jgi:hypothetical protein
VFTKHLSLLFNMVCPMRFLVAGISAALASTFLIWRVWFRKESPLNKTEDAKVVTEGLQLYEFPINAIALRSSNDEKRPGPPPPSQAVAPREHHWPSTALSFFSGGYLWSHWKAWRTNHQSLGGEGVGAKRARAAQHDAAAPDDEATPPARPGKKHR